jgi:hypothetical protein
MVFLDVSLCFFFGIWPKMLSFVCIRGCVVGGGGEVLKMV